MGLGSLDYFGQKIAKSGIKPSEQTNEGRKNINQQGGQDPIIVREIQSTLKQVAQPRKDNGFNVYDSIS